MDVLVDLFTTGYVQAGTLPWYRIVVGVIIVYLYNACSIMHTAARNLVWRIAAFLNSRQGKIVVGIIGLLFHITDVGTDANAAVEHGRTGHWWRCYCTAAFTVGPMLLATGKCFDFVKGYDGWSLSIKYWSVALCWLCLPFNAAIILALGIVSTVRNIDSPPDAAAAGRGYYASVINIANAWDAKCCRDGGAAGWARNIKTWEAVFESVPQATMQTFFVLQIVAFGDDVAWWQWLTISVSLTSLGVTLGTTVADDASATSTKIVMLCVAPLTISARVVTCCLLSMVGGFWFSGFIVAECAIHWTANHTRRLYVRNNYKEKKHGHEGQTNTDMESQHGAENLHKSNTVESHNKVDSSNTGAGPQYDEENTTRSNLVVSHDEINSSNTGTGLHYDEENPPGSETSVLKGEEVHSHLDTSTAHVKSNSYRDACCLGTQGLVAYLSSLMSFLFDGWSIPGLAVSVTNAMFTVLGCYYYFDEQHGTAIAAITLTSLSTTINILIVALCLMKPQRFQYIQEDWWRSVDTIVSRIDEDW